jgi:hypothetical protein
MADETIRAVVTIATAIVGLAVLSVLVGSRSQTSNVLRAAGGAFSQSLTAAEAPVLGSGSAYGGYGAPFGETIPIY